MQRITLLTICSIVTFFCFSQKDSLILKPQMDNTIFEDSTVSGFSTNSNGAGEFFFVGNTAAGNARRALLKFDLSDVDPSATIDSVVLIMTTSKNNTTAQSLMGHVLKSEWGEGTTNASGNEGSGGVTTSQSATWEYAFFDVSKWSIAGGDFLPSTWSATIEDNKKQIISSSGLINDVNAWVDGSIANHGWILLGNEDKPQTAYRFNSRENGVNPPVLKIYGQNIVTSLSKNVFESSFELFPNPTNESFTILGLNNKNWILNDVTGKIVAQGNSRTIDVSSYTSGVYFLQVDGVVKRVNVE